MPVGYKDLYTKMTFTEYFWLLSNKDKKKSKKEITSTVLNQHIENPFTNHFYTEHYLRRNNYVYEKL